LLDQRFDDRFIDEIEREDLKVMTDQVGKAVIADIEGKGEFRVDGQEDCFGDVVVNFSVKLVPVPFHWVDGQNKNCANNVLAVFFEGS